jgi:hypothetical protein
MESRGLNPSDSEVTPVTSNVAGSGNGKTFDLQVTRIDSENQLKTLRQKRRVMETVKLPQQTRPRRAQHQQMKFPVRRLQIWYLQHL